MLCPDSVKNSTQQENTNLVSQAPKSSSIKHSEYIIIDQLNKQPAKISRLSLLLNLKAHRNALLKVLNEAYVPLDIFIGQLDRLVNNITTKNYISFSDAKIPQGGRGNYKALQNFFLKKKRRKRNNGRKGLSSYICFI